jgi:hypothetical protein
MVEPEEDWKENDEGIISGIAEFSCPTSSICEQVTCWWFSLVNQLKQLNTHGFLQYIED